MQADLSTLLLYFLFICYSFSFTTNFIIYNYELRCCNYKTGYLCTDSQILNSVTVSGRSVGGMKRPVKRSRVLRHLAKLKSERALLPETLINCN